MLWPQWEVMWIHNPIKISNSSKDIGEPLILLFACVIKTVSMYILGVNKQNFIRHVSPLSASSPNPDILSLLWWCIDDILLSIPSHTQVLYIVVYFWVSGFGMLLVTGSLSSSTSYPCAQSLLIFSRKVDLGVMWISASPSSGNYVLLEFSINELLIGNYMVSRPSVMTFIHRSKI